VKRPITAAAALFVATLSTAAVAAPTRITFWHSMSGAEKAVTALVDSFNRSQADYQVVALNQGTYPDSQTKLIAALRAKAAPVLYQAEIGFFPRLVEDGAAADLSALEKTLPASLTGDFYPAIWNYGVFNGKRYGLPWNASTPVLFYNADLFASKNLKPPTTWTEFAATAKALSTRATKGFIAFADDWQFEQMVLSRGGRLVTEDGKPNFASAEVVEALTFLQGLAKSGHAIPRSLGEQNYAMLDFLRTKAGMVIASIANWPDVLPLSITFKLGVAPLPKGTRTIVPFGGAQLVVLNGASDAEKAGAFAFWQYLMRPESITTWTKASYYIPVRRSAMTALRDWYAENPYRRTAFEQLDEAVSRPRAAGYSTWAIFLREAIERAIKDTNASPRVVLEQAQQRALAAIR
jgi:ABC-type glycerol-3-phosphate transport system substrate-binding protein